MLNFEYYAPTKVVFGRDVEGEVGRLVQQHGCRKVLVHYGSQSAKKSGLLDRVCASLEAAGVAYVSLGGVVPNPRLSLVYEGVALAKAEGVDFLLAIGGGSVIDSAKAIAYGAATDTDVWDFYMGKATPEKSLPVGAVLTIAAAGSEMSNSSVITNTEAGTKRGVNNDLCRCRFAVMNPALTLTLPAYQTAVGCADILMHLLERYFTPEPHTMQTTDALAEALMRNIIANARKLTRAPDDYDTRAEVMWTSSLAHNGLAECGGGRGDWGCHQMSHELSAMFDMAHGAALTCVFASWARHVYKKNPARFARLAVEVLGVQPGDDDEALALAGIEEVEGFFWSIELPTSISEAGIELTDAQVKELAERCSHYGERRVGAFGMLDTADLEKIFAAAR